jgi:hypothetical protein
MVFDRPFFCAKGDNIVIGCSLDYKIHRCFDQYNVQR